MKRDSEPLDQTAPPRRMGDPLALQIYSQLKFRPQACRAHVLQACIDVENSGVADPCDADRERAWAAWDRFVMDSPGTGVNRYRKWRADQPDCDLLPSDRFLRDVLGGGSWTGVLEAAGKRARTEVTVRRLTALGSEFSSSEMSAAVSQYADATPTGFLIADAFIEWCQARVAEPGGERLRLPLSVRPIRRLGGWGPVLEEAGFAHRLSAQSRAALGAAKSPSALTSPDAGHRAPTPPDTADRVERATPDPDRPAPTPFHAGEPVPSAPADASDGSLSLDDVALLMDWDRHGSSREDIWRLLRIAWPKDGRWFSQADFDDWVTMVHREYRARGVYMTIPRGEALRRRAKSCWADLAVGAGVVSMQIAALHHGRGREMSDDELREAFARVILHTDELGGLKRLQKARIELLSEAVPGQAPVRVPSPATLANRLGDRQLALARTRVIAWMESHPEFGPLLGQGRRHELARDPRPGTAI